MLFHLYKNAPHPPALPVIRSVPLSNVPTMISSTTPYKLADIIRDTWPQLYRPAKDFKPPSEYKKNPIQVVLWVGVDTLDKI